MKFLKNIFTFISAAVLAAACSGTVDDSTLPVLEASSAEIDLADGGSVEFTVTYEGVDVTAESELMLDGVTRTQDSWDSIFTPEETGSYTFSAIYDGKRSNHVTINVIDTHVESKYEKHVSIIEFTGAWCKFCPAGYDSMMMQLSGPSFSRHGDRVHIVAFHSDSSGADAMAIPATEDIFKMFKGIEFPSFVCDLNYAGNLNSEAIPYFKESLAAALNDENVHCGVAVSSKVDEGRSEASVEVKVTSEMTSKYRVVVIVVENKVTAPETPQVSPLYDKGNPDHVHMHVARRVVTSYENTFTGESLTETGTINAGEEASKNWKLVIDPKWKLGDTEIYALVLDADGHVNNMNVCPIADGRSDYNLKK